MSTQSKNRSLTPPGVLIGLGLLCGLIGGGMVSDVPVLGWLLIAFGATAFQFGTIAGAVEHALRRMKAEA